MKQRKIGITGIGNDVGKTLISAIVTQALGADYWKPIQCGIQPRTDSDSIRHTVNHPATVVHPEAIVLQLPASPHEAAAAEGIAISTADFKMPDSNNPFMVIEGAGGLMVPLNNSQTTADLFAHLHVELIVVSRFYLGSINHTLLTIQEIKRRQLPLLGILYNGQENAASRRVIEELTQVPTLGVIPAIEAASASEDFLTPDLLTQLGKKIDWSLFQKQ